MTPGEHNRQVRKTRTALLEAFNKLVLARRYADIRVADIIRRADVGRSTFYEHFRSKDDLLRQSLSGVLAAVADAVEDGCDLARLRWMLEHFGENSRLARGLVNGPSARQVVAVLAGLIDERLTARCRQLGRTPALPLDLVAAGAAEGLLGLVRAWLDRGASCPSATVAAAMHRSATASLRALLGG
jgi:AcrR family transcriptional regulator